MSFKGRIGDVVETGRGEMSSFEWRIPDFLSLAGERGDRYISPVFDACDGKWSFTIYPRGLWRDRPSDSVSLYLWRLGGGPPKTLDVTLGIRGAEGVENRRGRVQEFSYNDDPACFWYDICRRSKLRGQNSRLMPGNVLILTMDMKSVVPSVAIGLLNEAEGNNGNDDDDYDEENDENDYEDNEDDKASKSKNNAKQQNQVENAKKRIETLVKDFGKLLSSDEDSDVNVQVGDVEFRVHRNILSVRSPVLSAMFKHETEERATNRVTIEDCEPKVFKEYLQYLYTGSVGLLSEQNVFLLYRVADKYLADELKEQCLLHIQDTLSVQTFCDTVKVALTHGESGLLEQAIDFATENIRSIIRTVEWQNFAREYPTEANEVLIKSLGPPCASQKSKR